MKKHFLFLFMFLLCVSLVSCKEGKDDKNDDGNEDDPIVETDPLDLAIQQVLENNYQLIIKIQDQLDVTTVTMKFAGNISFYQDGSLELFYERNGRKIKEYKKEGSLYSVTETTLPKTNTYLFYQDFKAEDFDFAFELYNLKYGNYDKVTEFFKQSFPDAVVENLAVSLRNDSLDKIIFNLTINEVKYLLTFEFSMFNEVNLTLPTNLK